MTLRENSSGHEIPPSRKYSVSHSGRFKSRPKIRPSLSGDVFRPEPVNAGGTVPDSEFNRTEEKTLSAEEDIVVQRAVEQLDSIIGDCDAENPPTQKTTRQPHGRRPSSHAFQQKQHQQSTREILETSL
ncbi:uncharacterized protein LOC5577021 isoform X2 [Aedes aegypti]|uniref:Uncharacterized protein n=1 Tax=Aedes aegypti TaxID=7159 RepID=A0A6I8TMD0_AEDAE|nr:uncharacterized protein LOC5577021 isoform X2 [Aedes aegypti]